MHPLPRLACLLLLVVAAAAQAAPEETWMSVTLDGRKIGHMLNRREVRDDRVVTTQTMNLGIERAGITVALEVSETHEETAAGKPLAFHTRSRMSGVESTSDGTVAADGAITVRSSVGGLTQDKQATWPAGALFSEGLRLEAVRRGLAPGTRYESLAYQALNLEAFALTTTIKPAELVDVPGGRRELIRVERELKLPGLPLTSTDWMDRDYQVRKVNMSQLGLKLEVLACDQACALAPNQPGDSLQQALVRAPRSLKPADLQQPLRYRLRLREAAGNVEFPQTGEQRVDRNGAARVVTVSPQARVGGEAPPLPADSQPNDWLQSNASEIVRLAEEASPGDKKPAERMRELEAFVAGYIDKKGLSVGYASALETARSRQGDCTEHALLLAALGRARGIPTRIATGLAFTEQFGGAERVFVPHAWVQAWVDGRWQSYDAALGRFDSGHIALGVGDGDPWRFFSGVGTLGNLQLEAIDKAPAH
ncbi:transglutaminase-like domain-containing protein [Tahibacter caeni]|uniref:transglutaminase-like domain-containing protein n=1 Tax=Tahibacter caeni TaxID=1453545 RepID=UPI0021481FEB|nr:transglutaminase-like domain-containing protein [Tahibacter caeni]